MEGKAFLEMARRVARYPEEVAQRTAAGRAYYALLHEAAKALRGWGWSDLARDRFHTAVRLQFRCSADPDLQTIGRALEELSRLRNEADYTLSSPGLFHDGPAIRRALDRADEIIQLIEAIDIDKERRTAAITSLPKHLPF